MGKPPTLNLSVSIYTTRFQIPTKGNDIPPSAVPIHEGPNGQLYIARGLLGVNSFVNDDLTGILMLASSVGRNA